MASGISARAIGAITNQRLLAPTSIRAAVPVVFEFTCVAATSTYSLENPGPKNFKVTRAYGIMTGAGAAADTVLVQRIRAGTTTSITNTADLSVMSDTDQFDFGQINDANQQINQGDTLRVTTASGSLCTVYVEGFWVE